MARQKPRQQQPTLARQIALNLLDVVMSRGLPLQDSIEADPRYAELEARDRRFCRRLVTLTLRHHGQARAALAQHVKKIPDGRNQKAGLILIMGAAELMAGDASPHAVVDQSVRLAHFHKCGHLGGLVNAVLRKITPESKPEDPMLNLPSWLKKALKKDWGKEQAATVAAMLMQPPPLDLRPKSDASALAKKLDGCETPNGSVRLNDGMVMSLPGYDEGAWWVQDAAASIAAQLLDAKAGETVIDLCAAPGGKTAQLCSTGATVIAVDAAKHRMGRLKANMQRLGFNPDLVLADGMSWLPDYEVDAVLLDAPCSATGTIRRRPDILCHQSPPDLAKLNRLQQGLLKQAARMVKPGGIVVYVTCSIMKDEGEKITANAPQELIPMPISDEALKGFRRHPGNADHEARLMPDALELHQDFIQGNDGFYIARFRQIREE